MARVRVTDISSPWIVARGSDLLELLENNDPFGIEILEESGVYMWKRHNRAPEGLAGDPVGLLDWLVSLADSPFGEAHNQRIGRLVIVKHLEVNGGALPAEKRSTLKRFLENKQNRVWILRYTESLAIHAPPLYVGETESLPRRAKEHMTAGTGFGSRVLLREDLSWEDLDFWYHPLGDGSGSKKARTALEFLAVSMTLAGFTERPG